VGGWSRSIDRSIAIQPSSESIRSRPRERRYPPRNARRRDATRRSGKPNPRAAIPEPETTRNARPVRVVPNPTHPCVVTHRTPKTRIIHSELIENQTRAKSIDRSIYTVRTLTLLTDRRVIVTIVVAVDARHAACIIDIDIGIESIDRVLSLPLSVVPTTTTARMIGHSGTLLFTYLPPSMGLSLHNYIGVMMYLILYRCACEKRTTRDGTGGRSDRTGLDDSDDDSGDNHCGFYV